MLIATAAIAFVTTIDEAPTKPLAARRVPRTFPISIQCPSVRSLDASMYLDLSSNLYAIMNNPVRISALLSHLSEQRTRIVSFLTAQRVIGASNPAATRSPLHHSKRPTTDSLRLTRPISCTHLP